MYPKTYSIEDLWYHWDCLSNDGHWTLSNGFSFSSNGITMNSASSNGVCDITFPSNVEIEFTGTYPSDYGFMPQIGGFNIYQSNENSERLLVLRDMNDPNSWNNRTNISNHTKHDGTFIIRIENNVGSVIYNNTVIGTKNLITNNQQLILPVNSNSNRQYTFKDIKVRPL